MMRKVFETYVIDPARLGEAATRRIEKEGLHRTVCDYIAGMTDRYLMEEFSRISPDASLQARGDCTSHGQTSHEARQN
jgi:dGTP triphosphohydrolase